MAITYIDPTGLAFDVIKAPVFNQTPTTGTRLDLPVAAGQTPLVFNSNMIEDDTQRPDRETSAPTRGHITGTGTVGGRFRPCAAMDLLIESALAGEFDGTTGILFGGEKEVGFTMFTRLAKQGVDFLGYEDRGCVASKFSLTANAREGVNCSFDILGTSRVTLTTANALTVAATDAIGFNYIDIKNVEVAGEEIEFIGLSLETGTPRDHRIVFGAKNATSIATTGSRQTTLNLKGYRKGFTIDALVDGDPVEVKFDVVRDGVGYRITLPAAMCNSPTDELSDTGLLINLDFMATWDEVSNTGIIVQKLSPA